MNIEEQIKIVKNMLLHAETQLLDYEAIAIETILTAYEKEKEKNKKAIKYCKEKSTFQTFGDFELQNILETYINRLKHRVLDILEE